MAWLESKGNVFRIRFRFGGSKQLHALSTSDEREAGDALTRFKEHTRLLDRGIIAPPLPDADIGVYIMSAGRLVTRPTQTPLPERPTLGKLLDGYLDGYPESAKEASTWKTEKIHIAHFRRLINVGLALAEITPRTMQAYVDARAKETGRKKKPLSSKTIQKEIGTLAAIWNRWGVPQELIDRPAPTARLNYPKEKARPPFQTREQIERQIARQKLSPDEQAALWRCLFLTLPEIEEVLDHIQKRKGPAYHYPLFVFATHTGARRSEIRRSLMSDFDFEARTVLIREKKKDHAKELTFRTVPMSPRLEKAMQAWFAMHPDTPYTICTKEGLVTDNGARDIIEAALARSKWSVIPRWHCFRHSFISNCVAKGIDQRLIDFWAGHSTDAMRKRYSHLVPRTSQAALLTVFGQTGRAAEAKAAEAKTLEKTVESACAEGY